MPPHSAGLLLATSQNGSTIQFDHCKLGLLTLFGKEWGAFLRCLLRGDSTRSSLRVIPTDRVIYGSIEDAKLCVVEAKLH